VIKSATSSRYTKFLIKSSVLFLTT